MYRPTGPRELWTEHLMANPTSFSGTAGQTSDQWLYTARIDGTPARSTHAHDNTTYANGAVEPSWGDRYYGTLSPAKVTAAAQGSTRGGNLT